MLEKLRTKLSWRITPPSIKEVIRQATETADLFAEVARANPDWQPVDLVQAYYGKRMTEVKETLREGYDEVNGWVKLAPNAVDGIQDAELIRADAVYASRYYSLRDPLYHAAINLIIYYVWGRGVSVNAKDEAVKRVIDDFQNDPDNDLIARITGQWELSKVVEEDGEVFLTFFVDTRNGKTQVSYVTTDEIAGVIVNPDDRRKPAYYKRVYAPLAFDFNIGQYNGSGQVVEYWPDTSAPETRADFAGRHELNIVTGTEHATVGDQYTRQYMHQYKVNTRGQRGMPAHYSTIPYVKAYKGFLQDRITLLIALATFAFRQNVNGNQTAVNRIKSQWGSLVFNRWNDSDSFNRAGDMERAPGARILLQNEQAKLEQFAVDTGAGNAYQDGSMLINQVAAGSGFTAPDLSKDPQRGNLATAEAMAGAQLKMLEWWQSYFGSILDDVYAFVVSQAIRYGTLSPMLADGTPRNLEVEIDFPPLTTESTGAQIGAIATLINAQAMAGREFLSQDRMARYVLQALGEKDVDAAIAELTKTASAPPLADTGFDLPDSAADELANMRGQLEALLTEARRVQK